jgi:hypothetical protein
MAFILQFKKWQIRCLKNVCYLCNILGLGAGVMCIGCFLMSYTFGVEIIVMNCIGVSMGFKCNHMFHML